MSILEGKKIRKMSTLLEKCQGNEHTRRKEVGEIGLLYGKCWENNELTGRKK